MAKRKNFNELRETMSPEAIARSEEKAAAMLEDIAKSEKPEPEKPENTFADGDRVIGTGAMLIKGVVRASFKNAAGQKHCVVESDLSGMYIIPEKHLKAF